MNIYDFDGTIYHGESSTDFFFYCLKRYPKTWKYVLPTMFYGLGYLLRIVKKTKFKSKFFFDHLKGRGHIIFLISQQKPTLYI